MYVFLEKNKYSTVVQEDREQKDIPQIPFQLQSNSGAACFHSIEKTTTKRQQKYLIAKNMKKHIFLVVFEHLKQTAMKEHQAFLELFF